MTESIKETVKEIVNMAKKGGGYEGFQGMDLREI